MRRPSDEIGREGGREGGSRGERQKEGREGGRGEGGRQGKEGGRRRRETPSCAADEARGIGRWADASIDLKVCSFFPSPLPPSFPPSLLSSLEALHALTLNPNLPRYERHLIFFALFPSGYPPSLLLSLPPSLHPPRQKAARRRKLWRRNISKDGEVAWIRVRMMKEGGREGEREGGRPKTLWPACPDTSGSG